MSRWDDWVPQTRLRKLNEENKQMARDLKERMDNIRGVGAAAKAKKRALDSEFSSTRGSEDRQLSVAGRGHKRGRDNEIEKVGDLFPWLEAFPLRKNSKLAHGLASEKKAFGKKLRSPLPADSPQDARSATGRKSLQAAPSPAPRSLSTSIRSGGKRQETPQAILDSRIRKQAAWTEHGSNQCTTSYERCQIASPLTSSRPASEDNLIDEAFWNAEANCLQNAEKSSLAPLTVVASELLDFVNSRIPNEEGVDDATGAFLSAANGLQERSTTPEPESGSFSPAIAQNLLPIPAPIVHRSERKHYKRGATKYKDIPTHTGKRLELQATEERYARKKKSLNGPGAHAPLPKAESRKRLHPKLVPLIHNPSRLHFFSGVPHDMKIVIAGIPGKDTSEEPVPFDAKKRTHKRGIQFTDTPQQEEAFHSRPAVKINVPDHLKSILVDDWEYVTKNLSLTPVPNPHPVFEILDTYFEEKKGQRRLGSPEADILEEVVEGMKDYFNDCLGKILLYRFEREQYFEVRQSIDKGLEGFKDKSVGEIYGAEHLCRLIGE